MGGGGPAKLVKSQLLLFLTLPLMCVVVEDKLGAQECGCVVQWNEYKCSCNWQLDFYMNKIRSIMNIIPTSNRNPHRYIDRAMSRWEDKDRLRTFNFKRITEDEMKGLIWSLSDSTLFGHNYMDSIRFKMEEII